MRYAVAGSFEAAAGLLVLAALIDGIDGLLARKLNAASHFGADFYRLPRNPDTVTLERRDWAVPETVTAAGEDMVPFMAGQALPWAIRESQ